jgi:hypothetical protein
MYYAQVKAFMEEFSRVKVILSDDLKKDTVDVVKQVCEFLEVDSDYAPSVARMRYNTSGVPRSRALNKLFLMKNPLQRTLRNLGHFLLTEDRWVKFRDMMRDKLMIKPAIKPGTRNFLQNVFREDILKLQDLLGRDLGHWLNPGKTGS